MNETNHVEGEEDCGRVRRKAAAAEMPFERLATVRIHHEKPDNVLITSAFFVGFLALLAVEELIA